MSCGCCRCCCRVLLIPTPFLLREKAGMKLEPQNSSQERLGVVKSQEKRVWMEQHVRVGVGDAHPGEGKTRGNSLLKD